MIREGATHKDVCEAENIVSSTFYDWMAKKKEFSEAIQKASEDYRKSCKTDFVPKFAKIMEGYFVEEEEKVFKIDANGSAQVKEIKMRKKYIPPNVTAMIFMSKSLYPEVFGKVSDDEDSGATINVARLFTGMKKGLPRSEDEAIEEIEGEVLEIETLKKANG